MLHKEPFTTVVSQLREGGSPITSTSTAGNTFYENLSDPHLRIHRVWNIDQALLYFLARSNMQDFFRN